MHTRPGLRTRAWLIAVLVMAGLALPAIATGSIEPPVAERPVPPLAPPSDKPTPKPKPTRTPAPPLPTPTPPIPTPLPPPPTSAPATPAPTPVRTTAPAPATAKPAPVATAGPAATTNPAPVATAAPAVAATAPPTRSGDPLAPAGAGHIDPTGGQSGAPSPIDGLMEDVAGIGGPLAFAVLALVAVTIGRRRLGEGETVTSDTGSPDPDGRLVARIDRPAELQVAFEDQNVPRWLRPSLRAERFGAVRSSPRVLPAALLVPPPTRTPLAFAHLPEDPESRRIVRSDGVALLDAPDEVAGHPLAQLEKGDEIEAFDEAGGWVNVFTPTGRAGWLPASSLGPAGQPVGSDDATAQEGSDAIDLASILAARSRRQSTTEPPVVPADPPRSAATPGPPAGSRRAAPRKRRMRASPGAGEAGG
jgi:hypothetical protein